MGKNRRQAMINIQNLAIPLKLFLANSRFKIKPGIYKIIE